MTEKEEGREGGKRKGRRVVCDFDGIWARGETKSMVRKLRLVKSSVFITSSFFFKKLSSANE